MSDEIDEVGGVHRNPPASSDIPPDEAAEAYAAWWKILIESLDLNAQQPSDEEHDIALCGIAAVSMVRAGMEWDSVVALMGADGPGIEIEIHLTDDRRLIMDIEWPSGTLDPMTFEVESP